jgi:cyclopropane fatty-acyl-phospholipid synthase-like methyltransferase
MSDWDAAKYHRISDPQLAWGRAVAARLTPAAGERILDVGCGTGRLTEEIAQTPGITFVGLDRSAAMLRQACSRASPVIFERPEQFSEFVSAVCFRHHLDRLPAGDHDGFMHRVTEQALHDEPPLTLDYWRLNIRARKARS